MKICHLTSAHPRFDTRIFVKQCQSLVRFGAEVFLVVADGAGDQIAGGVNLVDCGRLKGRANRILKTTKLVLNKAVKIDADIYHLHDPELIPIGLKLKRMGKKVIFDAHEDLPKQLLSKPYLGPRRLKFLSKILAYYENYSCAKFDGIVAATPYIRDKFLKINHRTIDVNNFPVIGELESFISWSNKSDEICYVGGITATRGIREIVRSLELLNSNARLNLAGNFIEPAIESEVKSAMGWNRVNELGFLDRTGVRDVLGRSVAGLVTLLPSINYLDSLPVKMFEYMAAGIPVISSDFPLWENIIESNKCGLCVDPTDPTKIANAIDFFVSHPAIAQEMGENGRRAILEKYNWKNEEEKLFSFYREIFSI